MKDGGFEQLLQHETLLVYCFIHLHGRLLSLSFCCLLLLLLLFRLLIDVVFDFIGVLLRL
jgi:hypothetical protein